MQFADDFLNNIYTLVYKINYLLFRLIHNCNYNYEFVCAYIWSIKNIKKKEYYLKKTYYSVLK